MLQEKTQIAWHYISMYVWIENVGFHIPFCWKISWVNRTESVWELSHTAPESELLAMAFSARAEEMYWTQPGKCTEHFSCAPYVIAHYSDIQN